MAGTPTQYYGFPTYADSDAVDLTAQYNTAVTNIDSELHQIDIRVNSLEPGTTIIACGDSWTDVDGHTGNFSWLDNFPNSVTVYKYAVWGSTVDEIVSQIKTAASEHPFTGKEYIIAVGGVNSYAIMGDDAYSALWNSILDAFNAAYSYGYPPDRVQWFLNDGRQSRLAIPSDLAQLVETAKIYGHPIHASALYLIKCNLANNTYLDDDLHPTSNGAIILYAAIMDTVFGFGCEFSYGGSFGEPSVNVHSSVSGDSFKVTFAGETTMTIADPPADAPTALAQYTRRVMGAGVSGSTITATKAMGYLTS